MAPPACSSFPTAIRRKIEELGASFTAMQSATGERFAALETRPDEQRAAIDARFGVAQREGRILAAIVAVLVVVAIVATFLS